MAGILHLDKRIENVRQHIRRNAAAGIGNGKLEIPAGIVRGNGHGSLIGKLDRIPDQIEQNLTETMFIQQNRRHLRSPVDQFDPFPRGDQAER